ncbi:winged helix-turn-helix domain-containing protein [Erythrobacter sp. sf7]|uniref:Winged helix-turn-helix domain-containing protein n=1 Tax=Erythrobacter fulvus TaxID=2987523 RepID=A0ABT5JS50_9SPHN|nr:winged helix-turn-helix domain-containing protein [Erythrobacter fulvus]MDC8754963.1 winged helix-turn-helix domain-containing protein [Erythrobacter fulvus]
MKDDSLSSTPRLSRGAARLLISRRTLLILESTTQEARTAKQIAADLGQSVERTWHHLRAMIAAGLLIEAGERQRAGRPQKLYRVASERFFVQAELRKGTVGAQLSKMLRVALEHEDQSTGELFYFDGNRWRVEKAYDPLASVEDRQHDLWAFIRLSATQRRELATEMEALLEKYTSNQSLTAPRSLVRFASVSLPPEFD